MNSIILPDISWKRSLILRCTFRIGTETIFWQLYEINTSLWQSVLLLAICNSFFHCHLHPLQERNSPLYDSRLWVLLAFILSIKKDNCEELIRPQGVLLNWTHFKGGSQSCQNFDFLIPKEMLIPLAAWSTGNRNETPLAWPLVSIITGDICIYIVNAQTFFTSWSMKSPFRWRKKYNPPFLRDVAVLSKGLITQRNV